MATKLPLACAFAPTASTVSMVVAVVLLPGVNNDAFGQEDHGSDRTGVLQRRPRDLRRVDDALRSLPQHPLHHDVAVAARVLGDLAQGRGHGVCHGHRALELVPREGTARPVAQLLREVAQGRAAPGED
eukprot:CAMPEP_0179372760 /NCGR_PEP_ID=MMETSP0797-20121207/86461_1 /TAXON_ID=47934 /ORGANISM="Dinophysis acuminata, Strain DAEP01" /LENGTH=128 /DNA_ID=CAMNT_0021088761 /DNA_START=173 /DNA_END=556 /DNA_ORIENTATION=+